MLLFVAESFIKMRKFSTSLFIALLALLALPERVWAWTSVEFRASFDSWAEGHTMTRNNVNSFTYEFAASEDFTFKFYVSDNNGLWLGSYNTNYQTVSNYDGTKTYWCSNSGNTDITFKVDPRYTKYKIDLLWDNQSGDKHYFKYTVTGITEGGSEDTYNLVYLVDKALKDQQLHTWLEGGATDVDITKWDNRPTIGSGDFANTKTYNNTEYYTKTFSVNKTTADAYKQIGAKIGEDRDLISNEITSTWDNVQYIIVTSSGVNIVENTATMYTVTVSSADANMGTVSPASVSVNAATSQTVTATPNSGYEFVNWTASDGVSVADPSSATTTVTATQDGTLIANFKTESSTPTPTPTPILGNNFYLVGDLFDSETSINYTTRYFKFTDNGDNTYSLDIPATLTVNAQILSVNGSAETVYGPSSGQNGLNVTSSSPSNDGNIKGDLSEGSKTPTYYWNFQDRTLANDGIYTITITLNTEGVPDSWTITHDKSRRVAYYLSTSDGSTAQAAYAVKKDDGSSDNKFFGSVFLSKGTGCYVISNMTKNADSNNHSLLRTTTKFYLQGNASGDSPVKGQDANTKVYPVKYNGSATTYKPFVFSSETDLQLLLEYNPSKGHDGTATQYGGIGGEVLRANYGDASGVQLPEITSMKIVGPAVNNSWNLEDAVQMTYNDADNCWEATFNTSAAAGAAFRFVANDTWGNSWQENGITAADKAKIPYDGTGEGHAATTADPNEVSYISSLTSAESRDENYDIIFNRDHGTWRVRFYIETQSTSGGNSYDYVFKYTINGYKSVLRTYCSNQNEKPTDESIKIYGAYAFEGNVDEKSGTIKLYEMNYIPAGEGVILSSANAIDEWTFESHTPSADERKYKNIPDADYNNYLVGTTKDITVDASVFNGNNERTHRNFFFNYLKNTGYYTEGATDYLGFFRIKSGSTCKANHAYLRLPTSVLTWNGQILLEQVMKEYEESGEQAELTKGMRIVFSDGSDWEDNTTTAISVVQQAKPADNAYYTLQGVRVAAPAKGIYIHNGKKIIIR